MSHLSSDLCCYLQPLFILTTYRYIQGNKGILNITLLFLSKYHIGLPTSLLHFTSACHGLDGRCVHGVDPNADKEEKEPNL